VLSAIGVSDKVSDAREVIRVTLQSRPTHSTDHPAHPSAPWNIKVKWASRLDTRRVGTRRGKGVKDTGGSHSLPFTLTPSTQIPLSSVLTAAVTRGLTSSYVTSVPSALRQSMAVVSMFSMLIFKTIPRVRTHLIAGVLRPWTAAWECYFRLKLFHINVAELRQMKSAVGQPGARRECQAFVVGTKVVVQPVCSHIHMQAVPGRRPHIRCDGLLEWSL